jgi:IS30 family transposase
MMANSYRRLDLRERAMIEMYLAQGTRPGTIAVYLNRSRSMITRELAGGGRRSCPERARNRWPEATTASGPSIARGVSLRFRAWRASSLQAPRLGSW